MNDISRQNSRELLVETNSFNREFRNGIGLSNTSLILRYVTTSPGLQPKVPFQKLRWIGPGRYHWPSLTQIRYYNAQQHPHTKSTPAYTPTPYTLHTFPTRCTCLSITHTHTHTHTHPKLRKQISVRQVKQVTFQDP